MAYDPHLNFSYSTVLTAPSPASSGTSLVVQSGDGAKFPSVSFNATVWPVGVRPTTANAEIVRVTTISTDTFTITRTQESTSARSIIVGDQIAAGITAKTITDIEAAAPNGAWSTWTPTWTNLTIGNGTNSFSYLQMGKSVWFKGTTTLGSTSSIGTGPTFTLPVTSVTILNAVFPIGNFIYDNNSGSGFNGYVAWASTTTGKLEIWDTNNNFGQVTATNPLAFGTNYKIHVQGFYEAA